jgi:hypothetical protein
MNDVYLPNRLSEALLSNQPMTTIVMKRIVPRKLIISVRSFVIGPA